ncbi:ABC transporter [Candidatus Woesebacteria bacterium RIFCSPHIGHO2_02_FULL_42_20]|uniref:ABC transporter n=1 Tax=Candidatus Woesebacteria bacterium RIFCSPHIGHO2_12_FULL_41_24 TaxID=1802510 RepID=A0A1F8AS92_9BACT|nr:MAG: ABC transporter [Candidatus Woesebacteria bacterium RBG_16_41_13]OGM29078.1 MAG: ABC transporter [Candidatus Woesebacteria bacterium RIFCSPHIGHO2_01_FULL_42_80]OGM34786.1 MAG: ABC transporter [Candidatus Woesebacteria bacterium RIFCSPHIGHO2_02_FULL_42_20]OGM54561.1 MAG: ABC transporter [Candidatus Woesebacteria bacterium RIFCSPHIGHO2_12_FULL_41_24]OGM66732.1 MAG: ABC transporter [Candidatus Woesebacteria bacterium RIFCSPLOWO2_01_FULL_42_67]OGM71729.1 MAG: ABC transporter [Candidatus Wo
MGPSIRVNRLTKDFDVTIREPGLSGTIKSLLKPRKKNVHALKQVSFSIDKGELVGFIGPNGAGKTTTLKTLSGLLYPTSGHVWVEGYDPWERKSEFLKGITLVMGQKNQLWWDLPAVETFELNRVIYEVSKKDYAENLNELVSLLDAKKFLNIPVRRLSLGQRMRLELIAALIHKPKVLFLDEPTIGLDVVASQKMRDFIASYNKKYQATIVLTSHNMSDIANLAKRVIVIADGVIIFDGGLGELVALYAKDKIIKLVLSDDGDYKKLEKIGKVKEIAIPKVEIVVPRSTAALAASEILQNFAVEDLTIEEEPIESVIRRIFSGEVKKPGLRKRKNG